MGYVRFGLDVVKKGDFFVRIQENGGAQGCSHGELLGGVRKSFRKR